MKTWITYLYKITSTGLLADYLKCLDDYQKVHKSLKTFGIINTEANKFWTDELKNQGVDIVSSNEFMNEFMGNWANFSDLT